MPSNETRCVLVPLRTSDVALGAPESAPSLRAALGQLRALGYQPALIHTNFHHFP